jgi:broad specificity phosphatase PhoE
LTDFGKAQAKRAGADLRQKGVPIDVVFVSHMRRAQQTCEIVLTESGAVRGPSVSPHIDHRLAERSFGIFANLNYNLLRCSLGYRHFENMLHSPDEAPPAGEPIGHIYERFASFYEELVIPRLERGENVLVVSHQYLLEAAVLYLCGKRPEEYHHLKLPNGKALSREELIQ